MSHALHQWLIATGLLWCLPALAQGTAGARPPAITFATVAEALAALQAMDGNGSVVTHADGWVIVNEPGAAAQWSFTPPSHPAHPAVVRRIVRRSAGAAPSVDTASICEAPTPACDQLLAEFEALNSRITQAVRARGRQGSSQP